MFLLQNSWKQFIYARCQNVNRKGGQPGTLSPKRIKVEAEKHVYAELDFESDDSVSVERNSELLRKEMAKHKPKAEVVKRLIKRTLKARRQTVMDGCRPEEVLEKYPHLKKANYVSQG